jgi:hypothetical protein
MQRPSNGMLVGGVCTGLQRPFIGQIEFHRRTLPGLPAEFQRDDAGQRAKQRRTAYKRARTIIGEWGRPMTETNDPADLDISGKQRGRAIIEYVSAGLAGLTGGWSEAAMLPIRRVIERRLKELEETLVEEMRKGLITEDQIIDEDRLAAFILRVRRASMEGAARNKIRIIARYFFRNAPSPYFNDGAMADFVNITEQLTDDDMRCLAVIKHAQEDEYFERDAKARNRPHLYHIKLYGLFADQQSFAEAVHALGRFGLVYQSATMDSTGNRVTKRGLDYIENLDFDCIEQPT